jgi:type IV secretion system protein VirB5
VLKKKLISIATSCALLVGAGARAQVIVLDPDNMIHNIQQLLYMIEEIQNQITQIDQMRAQYQSLTGSRGLGSLFRNPAFDNYVPLNAGTLLQNIAASGYGGLSPAAKALRDAGMLYNCLDIADAGQRIFCQSQMAQPYQAKALWQQALQSANGRMAQVQGLISAINATSDPKAIAELQARIAGEQALIEHERSRAQMLRDLVQAEREVMEAQVRERNLDLLSRPMRPAAP